MKKPSLVHRNARLEVRRSEGSAVPHNLKKSKQLKLPLHLENVTFQNLKFCSPYLKDIRHNKKLNFDRSHYMGVPGLVIIRQGKKLIRINSSQNDLYKVYSKNIRGRNGHAKDYEYCVLEVPTKLQSLVKEKIRESYNNSILENTFEKVRSFVENNKPVPKRILKFIEPYCGVSPKNKAKKERTLGHFLGRPGVYLIKRNNKIVYIGMATCLTERCYVHFTKTDEIWGKGQVNYYDEINESRAKFKIAFIEFPKSTTKDGKTVLIPQTEIRILCEKYERFLITQFNPRDNKKGYLEPEEVLFTPEDLALREKWADAPPF